MPNLINTCKNVLGDEIVRLKEWLETHPENLPPQEFEKGDRFAAEAVNKYNHHQARERIADDEAALARIADGTYGVCVDCGGKIPDERLVVIPYASRCTPCQGKKGVQIR
ncbi:MAG: TraR/DksA C4-type zinc finger protein [bacterium]|nr:TraR/DksA C4-type zinc finger protein [bacterium]